MNCPYCKHDQTKVLEKRDLKEGFTRRRRECLKCQKRFTTYEKVEMLDLYVVKKDGRRELFDQKKIFKGIMRACEKRPISKFKIEKIPEQIELRLKKLKKSEIKSSKLGEMIANKLKKLDKVAYIRFASVYKEFEDVDSFAEEIKVLLKRKR
ncbi:MAG: transcriptional regulator NrdR [Minisyncoccales bacterium]